MNAYLVMPLIWLFLLPNNQAQEKTILQLSHTAENVAKENFNKGLLLLHNFEYVDAAEEFIAAQEKDPDFAMAYWGEAMTYDHPIWRDLNIDKARSALKKLGDTKEQRIGRGKTVLEKDFIAAVEILFGEGSKPDREKAYSTHLASMYEKYPDNADVATFYALSLLALKKDWTEWEQFNVRAAEIVNKTLEKNPEHPGALHYLVHADDHPLHARKGLAAADKYAKVASYAGHALHMPSHIYLALGMWDDVVRANEVSWKAGVDRKNNKKLSNDQLNYHAHLWLSYGYLQQGKFQRAKELVEAQSRFTDELSSPRARYHLMEMRGHYLFQTNDWNSPVADISYKTDDLDPLAQYTHRFLEGYRLFHQKDVKKLQFHLEEFEQALAKSTQLQLASQDIAVCGITRYADAAPTEAELSRAQNYFMQLKGLHAWLNKEYDVAESYIQKALPKDGSVVVGPPVFLLSPHELYGNFLLERNKPGDAITQFDKALGASPNRLVALKGKYRAATLLGNRDLAGKIKHQLMTNLKDADAEAIKGI